MAGLLSVGHSYKNNALQGLSNAADLEQQRANTKDQLDAADAAQTKSSVGLGAGLGYMAGSSGALSGIGIGTAATTAADGTAIGASGGSFGGPIGMAIGAAAGFLFSRLF